MNRYKSKRNIFPLFDVIVIALLFLRSFSVRNKALNDFFWNTYDIPIYDLFLAYAFLVVCGSLFGKTMNKNRVHAY